MINRLDGKLLSAFLTVLEQGSMSRAAERLGYVQSTVTSQIQQLEQECGRKLFHRMPRGVQPTEAGDKLAVYARQFLKLAEALEEDWSSMELPKGSVKVRGLESFCVSRLIGFFGPFFTSYPEVSLRLETGFQGDIVEEVAAHAVDFGIVPRDPGRDDMVFEPLVEEQMTLVASRELAEWIERGDWERLAGLQLIGFGSRCIYQTDGLRAMSELGLPLEPHIAEFPSTELIRRTVACGFGIAYVPEAAMERELAEGTVVRLPRSKPVPLMHGLLRHKERFLSAPARVFREKLLAYFRDIGERRPEAYISHKK